MLDQYHDDVNPTVTEKPSPPGYLGTRGASDALHGLVRNELYSDTARVPRGTPRYFTHWRAPANEKTHNFWSHRHFRERRALTLGDAGSYVAAVSEADPNSTWPACGIDLLPRLQS